MAHFFPPIAKSIKCSHHLGKKQNQTPLYATVNVANCDKHSQFKCPSSPKTISETEHLWCFFEVLISYMKNTLLSKVLRLRWRSSVIFMYYKVNLEEPCFLTWNTSSFRIYWCSDFCFIQKLEQIRNFPKSFISSNKIILVFLLLYSLYQNTFLESCYSSFGKMLQI